MRDGSFETPVLPTRGTANYSVSVGDWIVESGNVDLISCPYWQSYYGNQSVDMLGLSPGTISQDIPTIPGQAYQLSFAMAGNPDGGIQLVTMDVYWGEIILASPTFSSTHTKLDMDWELHQYTAIATSSLTRLKFKSTTTK